MGKFSMNIQHFRKEQISALEKHNLRKNKNYSNEEIDKRQSYKNKVLVDAVKSLTKDVTEYVEQNVDKSKSKITKNSIFVSSFVFTLPDSVPVERSEQYFKDCIQILESLSKKGNIRQAVIHYDETTPHMHLAFVPLTIDNCLSRKRLFTKSTLAKLQQKIATELREKGYDIEFPTSSKDKNYKSMKELKKQKSEMIEDIETLKKIKQELALGNLEVAEKYLSYMKEVIIDDYSR